jgi:hypothetical protein
VGSEYCSAKSFHRKSHGVILSFTLANLFSENHPLHVIELRLPALAIRAATTIPTAAPSQIEVIATAGSSHQLLM